jgi:hypothetical protein
MASACGELAGTSGKVVAEAGSHRVAQERRHLVATHRRLRVEAAVTLAAADPCGRDRRDALRVGVVRRDVAEAVGAAGREREGLQQEGRHLPAGHRPVRAEAVDAAALRDLGHVDVGDPVDVGVVAGHVREARAGGPGDPVTGVVAATLGVLEADEGVQAVAAVVRPADLEVQVRPVGRGVAGGAEVADELASLDARPTAIPGA